MLDDRLSSARDDYRSLTPPPGDKSRARPGGHTQPRRRGYFVAVAAATICLFAVGLWALAQGDDPHVEVATGVTGEGEEGSFSEDLVGLSLGDARSVAAQLGVQIQVRSGVALDEAIVVAQTPRERDSTLVMVDVALPHPPLSADCPAVTPLRDSPHTPTGADVLPHESGVTLESVQAAAVEMERLLTATGEVHGGQQAVSVNLGLGVVPGWKEAEDGSITIVDGYQLVVNVGSLEACPDTPTFINGVALWFTHGWPEAPDTTAAIEGELLATVNFELDGLPLAYAIADGFLIIVVENRTLLVDTDTGVVTEADPYPASDSSFDVRVAAAGDLLVALEHSGQTAVLNPGDGTWNRIGDHPFGDGFLLDLKETADGPIGLGWNDFLAEGPTRVARLDMATGQWTDLDPLPYPMNRGGIIAGHDRVMVSGTKQAVGNHIEDDDTRLVVMELVEDAWVELPRPDLHGQAAIAAPTEDGIVAWNNGLASSFFDGSNWQAAAPLPGPAGDCSPDGFVTIQGVVTDGCGGLVGFDATRIAWVSIGPAPNYGEHDAIVVSDDTVFRLVFKSAPEVRIYSQHL